MLSFERKYILRNCFGFLYCLCNSSASCFVFFPEIFLDSLKIFSIACVFDALGKACPNLILA